MTSLPIPFALLALTSAAHADRARVAALDPPAPSVATAATPSAPSDRVSIEVNVLWPFFPGGISEFRVVVPVAAGGSLVVGAYSDFASRVVRDDSYGKVANLSGKLGWRQSVWRGVHVEASANLGWRHEERRPPNDVTVDGFQIRLWGLAGYTHDFSPRLYANARAGLGVHIYRSDELGDLEKKLVPGADLNLGVRF